MIGLNNSSAIILFLVVLIFNISFVFSQISGELNANCKNSADCRKNAYECKNLKCDCAETYHPNKANDMCIGGIGKSCQADNNCDEGLFCPDTTTCVKRDSIEPTVKSCQTESECEQGETCSDSKCIKKEENATDKAIVDKCDTDANCKEGGVCTNNVCTYKEEKPTEDKRSLNNAGGLTKSLLLILLSPLLILLVSK